MEEFTSRHKRAKEIYDQFVATGRDLYTLLDECGRRDFPVPLLIEEIRETQEKMQGMLNVAHHDSVQRGTPMRTYKSQKEVKSGVVLKFEKRRR